MKTAMFLCLFYLSSMFVSAGAESISASIFTRNLLDDKYSGKEEVLKSLLVSRMSSEGFNIIDESDVVTAVNDARGRKDKEDIKLLKEINKLYQGKNTDTQRQYDMLDNSTVLRLSQLLNCDYFVVAVLTSFNENKKKFSGYGVERDIAEYVLRVSIKLSDAVNDGGSVYGDSVTVSEKIAQSANLQQDIGDMLDRMIDEASVKISENILERLKKLKKPAPSTDNVEFTVSCDVSGAVVELDGVAIGSAPGSFKVKPGLHWIRVSKPRYADWERRVNIFPQQVLNVSMVKSDKGMDADAKEVNIALDQQQRISDIENKNKLTDAEIYVRQKDADSREKLAEGQKEKDSQSYEKIEGAPPEIIYLDGRDKDGNVINNNIIDK